MLEAIKNDKKLQFGLVALGIILVYMMTRRSGGVQGNFTEGTTANRTLYVPTSEYTIEYVEGNKTTTNTDNRQNNTQNNEAKDGGVITAPTLPIPPVPSVPITIPKTPTSPTVPAQSKPTPAPKYKTYTIKKGDTLFKIAGSMAKVNEIAKLNGIKDPNKIYAGQTIKIPV